MKLTLEKPVYGGDCLARLPIDLGSDGKAGKPVFVPLTLPGETVEAHLIAGKRSFLQAEATAITTASPHRVEPACPYFGRCGGCHYQHADYATQLDLKLQILRETLTRAKVRFPAGIATLAAEPWNYRNRIRLALTPDGEVAYRGRRSHDLIPIRECPIAAPILVRAGLLAADFLRTQPLPVAEIELFTDPIESQLLLTLYVDPPPATALDAAVLASLQQAFGGELSASNIGVWLRAVDDPGQAGFLAARPPGTLQYPAAGFSYQVEHGSFFQVNRHLIDPFVALVTGGQTGQTAWDLYCGAGLFARPLTRTFAQVIAVESSPNALHQLQQNLAGTTAQPVRSTALAYLQQNRANREPRPDLIVLDPPRAGLGPEVTTLLNAIHASRIVYVSCDPVTLARDLHALTQERYRIDAITLADMFPQTFHLETVVHLARI